MRVRKVKDSHPDLDALDRELFPGDPVYKKAGALWWIVRDEGNTVAFAGMRVLADLTGFLCRAGVIDSYRGRKLQRRLIRVRVRQGKELGLKWLVTYTSPDNLTSANNLAREGFSLYAPKHPYGMTGALYFIMEL